MKTGKERKVFLLSKSPQTVAGLGFVGNFSYFAQEKRSQVPGRIWEESCGEKSPGKLTTTRGLRQLFLLYIYLFIRKKRNNWKTQAQQGFAVSCFAEGLRNT